MSGKKHNKSHASGDDPLFRVQQAASMTECTGILPAQSETPEERQNAAELGAIHPPDHDRS